MDPRHLTRHAADRWRERFPGEDLAAAWARSWRVPARHLLRAGEGDTVASGAAADFDPVTGALFVWAAGPRGWRVVTVAAPPPGKVRFLRKKAAAYGCGAAGG